MVLILDAPREVKIYHGLPDFTLLKREADVVYYGLRHECREC
jgi:hypothetical protein